MQHSKEKMCRMQNKATFDNQYGVTTRSHIDSQAGRRQTKWSLCAAVFRRQPNMVVLGICVDPAKFQQYREVQAGNY